MEPAIETRSFTALYMYCLQSEIRSLVTLGDSAAGGGGSVSWEVGKGRKKRKESTSGPQLFDNDVEWWGGEKVGYLSYIYHLPCCMCIDLSTLYPNNTGQEIS